MPGTSATLDSDVLVRIGEIAAAAQAADGAAPFNEATWRALHDRPADHIGWWLTPGGVALLIDGDLGLAVDPQHRRAGVARALLAEVLAVTGGERLQAWSHADHPGAQALATTHGFARVRELWVMRRSVHGDDGSPAALPPLIPPPGARLTSWASEPDPEGLLAVNAAAFADHPEQGAMDVADLSSRMASDWFDPAGLLMARDDESGELLGFHWTKRTGHDPDSAQGEVYVVGISPSAQGRGLGKALTLAGLHHLTEAGVAGIELYVESDNAAAIAVYSGLGFTHAASDTHVMYERA